MNIAEFLIAWRYIRARRREKFISVTALFSFIGIVLGVATLIIVTSVMNGFHDEFSSAVAKFNGNLMVYLKGDEPFYRDIVAKIEAIDGVDAAIPVIERHALSSNGRQVRGTIVCGIDSKDLQKYKLIKSGISSCNISKFNDFDTAIVGEGLCNVYNIIVGNTLTIMTPELEETGIGAFPIKKTLSCVATFRSGMHEYDSNAVIIPLNTAQKLFSVSGVSNVMVFTAKDVNVAKVKKEVTAICGDTMRVVDWEQVNSSFMNAIRVERNVMSIILTLITLVASFSIISCMIMLVKDKERDIAILKTIGMSDNAILRIFFMIGSSIGIFGTLIGGICGVLFSVHIDAIKKILERLLAVDLFPAEVYFLTKLPSSVDYFDVLFILVFAVIISCLATLYPAIKASKLQPAEVLKYE